QPTADTRSLTERVNVLIRDYNNPPAPQRFVPPGVVLPFAGATAPMGFLLCGGQAVSRATYAELFAAIGTTHGAGDGSTTFNLPDLRGRLAAGKDDMGGSAANRLTAAVCGIAGASLGAAGGNQRAQQQTVTLNIRADLAAGGGAAAVYLPGGAGSQTATTSSTGGSENVPPTIVLNHIIAT